MVGKALSIVVCVCGMFETDPKLDNKPKTRKQQIVGLTLHEHRGVCVECSKQTQNSETKLSQMRYRWNRYRSYIVNIVFLNYLMQK